MKKTILIIILAVLLAALPLTSETIDYPGDYSPGEAITALGMNSRFSLVYNLLNGELDADNIEDEAIGSAELAADSVGTSEISDGSIGNIDLASDADSLAKISGGAMVNLGGLIGINTSDPDNFLHIMGTASYSPIIKLELYDGGIDTGQIYGGIQFDGFDGNGNVNSGIRAKMIGISEGTTGQTGLAFYTSSSGGGGVDVDASTERMRITQVGKVGIGTDAPDTLLEIATAYDSASGLEQYGDFRISDNCPQIDFIDSDGSDYQVYVNSDKMRFISESWDSDHMVLYDGNVGIQTSTPTYTLHVTGSAYCTSSWATSDIRYKENITPIQSSLEKLSKLDGVNFTWKPEFREELHVSEGSQIGLIAQEVEKEFPELVNTDPSGYKAVAYDKFTAVLLQAIKEQQALIEGHLALIESQQEQIDEMREELDNLTKPAP